MELWAGSLCFLTTGLHSCGLLGSNACIAVVCWEEMHAALHACFACISKLCFAPHRTVCMHVCMHGYTVVQHAARGNA